MIMKEILAALTFVASFSVFAAPDHQETGTVRTTPNQTHNVSGLSIFRKCWEYQNTYRRRSRNMVNNCQPLRDKGCSRIGSSYVERDNSGTCVVYEQKYNYPDKPETCTEETACDQNAPCQNDEAGCFDTDAPPDKDFGQAVVMMGAAREAGMYGIDPNKVEIFKGYMEEYNIKVLGGTTLKSCCKSAGDGAAFSNYALLGAGMETTGGAGRGSIVLGSEHMYDSLYGRLDNSPVDKGLGAMNSWAPDLGDGVSNPQLGFCGFAFGFTFTSDFQFVGFDPYSFALSMAIILVRGQSSCGSAEQVVVMRCDQNLCVYIETYYSKGMLKVYVEKKERHCYFNSKLAKVINRQGRAQLGMPMNSCDNFNQAQLQALDFSRIDLSEFIADIVPKDMPASTMSSRVQQTVNRKAQSYYGQ